MTDPTTPSARAISDSGSAGEPTWSEKIKTVGGLVAVVVGVVAVAIIAIAALIKDTSTAATVASSAGGVIATIVGAFFGIKVGSDQTKAAIDGQQAEAAKAQVYAAHISSAEAPNIVDLAEKAARDVIGR